MRQVLPTKPLTRAIRYGPGFFSHWKNLVCADHGLKHWALAPGPDTILGPAQTATDDSNRLVSAKPVARPICLMALVLPFMASAVQTREMRVFAPADATMPPQPRGFQSIFWERRIAARKLRYCVPTRALTCGAGSGPPLTTYTPSEIRVMAAQSTAEGHSPRTGIPRSAVGVRATKAAPRVAPSRPIMRP